MRTTTIAATLIASALGLALGVSLYAQLAAEPIVTRFADPTPANPFRKPLDWPADLPFETNAHDGWGEISYPMIRGPKQFTPQSIFEANVIYNDGSVATAKANTAAIEACLAKMPDTGGTLLIRDDLFTWGMIKNPTRDFGTHKNAAINFVIVGTSYGRSRINNLKPDDPFAIELKANYAWYYPGASAVLGLVNIGVTSQSGGVRAIDCGKQLLIDHVRIDHCKGDGFHGSGIYGSDLTRLYATACGRGVVLENCIDVLVDITTRHNRGAGTVMKNCGLINGRVYSEGNGGPGYDFDEVNQSNITGWLELNNAHGSQIKLRNCAKSLKIGWFRETADCDPISSLATEFALDFAKLPRSDLVKVVKFDKSATQTHAFWKPGFQPKITPLSTGFRFDVPAGMFTNAAVAGPWVEMYTGELGKHEFGAGDWLDFTAKVSLSPDAAKYWAAGKHCLTFYVSGGEVFDDAPYVQVIPNGNSSVTCNFRVPTKRAGKGARLFMFPLELPAGDTLEPPTAHTYTISDVVLSVVKGEK